jgi:hypothetical protein
MQESPIFVKTFDLLKWILGRTENFPKSQRFFLAKRLNDAMFDFYERIGEAAMLKRRQRQRLQEADVYLLRARHYVRLAMELHYLSLKQYEYAARELQEIGRLLGAWLKQSSSVRRGSAHRGARGRDDAERGVEQSVG